MAASTGPAVRRKTWPSKGALGPPLICYAASLFWHRRAGSGRWAGRRPGRWPASCKICAPAFCCWSAGERACLLRRAWGSRGRRREATCAQAKPPRVHLATQRASDTKSNLGAASSRVESSGVALPVGGRSIGRRAGGSTPKRIRRAHRAAAGHHWRALVPLGEHNNYCCRCLVVVVSLAFARSLSGVWPASLFARPLACCPLGGGGAKKVYKFSMPTSQVSSQVARLSAQRASLADTG